MKTLFCSCLLLLTLNLASTSTVVAQTPDTATIYRTDVSFKSGGLLVKGWVIMPASPKGGKLPAIVMAPGFSGTKECNYQFFADHFAKSGFAVLLFDYPNFGESAVHVKGEVDPWQQIQAYRDGISFLETLPDIDLKRIGVWGGSYSGGHTLVVSAIDHRVKCLVAMTPFISGSYYVEKLPPEAKAFLHQQFDADRLARTKDGEPARIPVAGNDPHQFTAISSPHAWEFIQSFKTYAPTFENLVTLKSLEMQLEYEPGRFVPQIGAKPKLFIIAKKDELVPEQLILDAYNKAAEPKKLLYLDGHHFSPYMDKWQEAGDMAIEWFKSNL